MLNVNLDSLSTLVHLLPEHAEAFELSTTLQETFDKAVKGTNLPGAEPEVAPVLKCVANKDFSLSVAKVQSIYWGHATSLSFSTPEFSIEILGVSTPDKLKVTWNGNDLHSISKPETWDPDALTYIVKNSEHKVIAKTILEAAKDTVLGCPNTNKNLGLPVQQERVPL